MSICIDSVELNKLGSSVVDDLKECARNSCSTFSIKLARLEGYLHARYDMAVASAQQATEYKEEAQQWKDLEAYFVSTIDQVRALVAEHSHCPMDLTDIEALFTEVRGRARLFRI